jgi:SAM-dependent methyltransferase
VSVTATIHTPGYLLRRRAVLRALRDVPPGRVLEIGCGRGELLARLGAAGWTGLGLELAPAAAAVARAAVAPLRGAIRVEERPEDVAGTFGLVLATEVLEHVEDDVGALRAWARWVAPGGRLLLTVPAHARCWTAADEFVGHYRRYDRAGLVDRVRVAGLAVERVWSFGFPLTALTIPLRGLVYRRRLAAVRALARDERGRASSFDSARTLPGGAPLALGMEALGLAFHLLQVPFLGTSLGGSWLIVARRMEGST